MFNWKLVDETGFARNFFGKVFVDPQSGFELNYGGVLGFNLNESIARHQPRIDEILEFMKDIEAGEIVNRTAVEKESENRPVDHYNLRKKGAGLNQTLAQWRGIEASVQNIIRSGKYEYVIFNGIGGSYLGPRLALEAKHGEHFNLKLKPRLIFLANTDPDEFRKIKEIINPKKTLIVNISKSGGTAETKGNMEAFEDLLAEYDVVHIGKHNIAITTPHSKFAEEAKKKMFLQTHFMNEATGGRTSVGSAVGMVPMAFGGVDFEKFVMGQSHMDELCRQKDPRKNPAMILMLAWISILEQTEVNKNLIHLAYKSSLKELAHYLQQLLMESLGKNYDVEGNPVRTGLTTFGGVGTGEQHAFMQQIQKGIRDAVVNIIHYTKRHADYKISKAPSMGRQLVGFVEGTEKALRQNGVDYTEMTFAENNEFNLGMMISLMENFVSFYAKWLKINAYDQPGVQDGKVGSDVANAFSKAFEEKLVEALKAGAVKGSAEEVQRQLGFAPEEMPLVYRALADIHANVPIENAYPLLHAQVQVLRNFSMEKGTWVYSVELVSRIN